MATAKRDLTDPQVQGPLHQRSARRRADLPHLLTVDEVASVLRVTPEYVTRWMIFTKRIQYVKVGRRPLVDERDLLEFMNRHRIVQTEEGKAPKTGARRRRRTN